MLTYIKFFIEAIVNYGEVVLKKLSTLTGMLLITGISYGAYQVYNATERTRAAAKEEKSSEEVAATSGSQDSNREPASVQIVEEKTKDQENSSYSENQNSDSGAPSFSPPLSAQNRPAFSPDVRPSVPAIGAFDFNNQSAKSGGNAESAKNSAASGGGSNPNGSADPSVGILAPFSTAASAPDARSQSAANSPTYSKGNSLISVIPGFAIISGGGTTQSQDLTIQAQIGEITSSNVQNGQTIMVVSGLTGVIGNP